METMRTTVKKRVTKLLALTTLITAMSANVFGFQIDTSSFDKRLDDGTGYKEYKLTNNSGNKIRYKFSAQETGEKGLESVNEYIKISPKVLTLEPYETGMVKIFGNVPKGKLQNGEYGFGFKSQLITIPEILKDSEVIQGKSSLRLTPILEMRGYVGDPEFHKNIVFEDIKISKVKGTDGKDKYQISLTINNKSFAGKNIGLIYYGENEYMLGNSLHGKVNSGEKKKIVADLMGEKIDTIVFYDGLDLEIIGEQKLTPIEKKVN